MIQCLGKIPSNVQSAVYHYFGGTSLRPFSGRLCLFWQPPDSWISSDRSGLAIHHDVWLPFRKAPVRVHRKRHARKPRESQAGASAGGAAASQGEDTYRATGPTKGLSCDLVYKYVFSNRWNCGVCVVFFQVKYDELDKNIVLFGGSCDIFFWEG